jgi:hypothetical protein
MKLTSMKLKKRDPEKMPGAIAMSPPESGDQYPYGLRIRLENEQLDKLGFDELPKVGEYVTITAECCVSSASQNERKGGEPYRTVELQIEKLGCEEDDDEDDVAAVSRGVKDADDDYA